MRKNSIFFFFNERSGGGGDSEESCFKQIVSREGANETGRPDRA